MDYLGEIEWLNMNENNTSKWVHPVSNLSIDGTNFLNPSEKDPNNTYKWAHFQTGYPSLGLPADLYSNMTVKLKELIPDISCADPTEGVSSWHGCIIPQTSCDSLTLKDTLTIQFNNTAVFIIKLTNLMWTVDTESGSDCFVGINYVDPI